MIYRTFAVMFLLAGLSLAALAQSPQVSSSMDAAVLKRLDERAHATPSAIDAKLGCAELQTEIERYMQDTVPPGESLATIRVAATSPSAIAYIPLGPNQTAVAGDLAQQQSTAIREEVQRKTAALVRAQPESRTVRVMQLQWLFVQKRCPPPVFVEK